MNARSSSTSSASCRAGTPRRRPPLRPVRWALLACFVAGFAEAASTDPEIIELETLKVIDATDVNQVLPNKPVGTLFGPELVPLLVPGSVSTVSEETIDRYGIRSTRDVITVVPGTFTPSNYGIDGGLRIRGEDGEVYFRGFRKLQNSALFPTPLGATQEVDVVRGPASAVFGPGRNSGFLNFVPKSARSRYVKGGQNAFGRTTATVGSYDYYKGTIEYGQPLKLGPRDGGFYFYGEAVDADSFYENDEDRSWLAQGSFDLNLTDRLTLQAGFMYYDWKGKNNIGWNRVTPELIADGTYITGQPVDINGYDGVIGPWLSPSDFSIASGDDPQNGQPFQFNSLFSVFFPFGAIPPEDPNAAGQSLWRLQNVGTTTLSPKRTLVDSVDFVWVENFTAYLDFVYTLPSGSVLKNQMFFDTYETDNYASYGFSGRFDAAVFENRLSLQFKAAAGDTFKSDNVVGVSGRYFDGTGLNAFGQGMQHADRRDLSIGATPNDRLMPAYSGERSWSLNEDSRVLDLGAFWQGSLNLGERLSFLAGARADSFDVETVSNGDFNTGAADDRRTVYGFSVGANYQLPAGFVPYVTYSRTKYLLNDSNGGSYDFAIVAAGDHLQPATLIEAGVKASLAEGKLYATFAGYQQDRTRTDLLGQPVELEATGYEFELRYAPSPSFSVTAAATWQETLMKDQNFFIRVPLPEVNRLLGTNLTPAEYYGGVTESTIEFLDFPDEYEAPGQPDKVLSLYGTYTTKKKFGLTAGVTYVPKVSPGFFDYVTLPEYYLVNSTLFYTWKDWSFALHIRNVLDEQYFTPQVFWDDLLVLPSEGRAYDFTVGFSW